MLGLLVMKGLRVQPPESLEAGDRVLLVMGEAAGLALSVPFHQVLEDADDLLPRKPRIEQRRPLPFREIGVAGATPDEPDVLGLSNPAGESHISATPQTRIRAPGIDTAQIRNVHRHSPLSSNCAGAKNFGPLIQDAPDGQNLELF